MNRRNPARKAKQTPLKKISKKPVAKTTAKKTVVKKEESVLITVAPSVSLSFPKKTDVLFMDGLFLTGNDNKLYFKKAYTKAGGSAGVVHLKWKSLGIEAIEFSTAYGDGVYGVKGNVIWIDSGRIAILAKSDYEKLVKAGKIEDWIETGTSPIVKLDGWVTAFDGGYATGKNGITLVDTR